MTHKKQMAYADADAYNVGYQAGKQTAELNYKAQLQTIAEHISIGRPVSDQDAWRQYAVGALNSLALAAILEAIRGNDGSIEIAGTGPIICEVADWMLAAEKQRFEKEKVSE